LQAVDAVVANDTAVPSTSGNDVDGSHWHAVTSDCVNDTMVTLPAECVLNLPATGTDSDVQSVILKSSSSSARAVSLTWIRQHLLNMLLNYQ